MTKDQVRSWLPTLWIIAALSLLPFWVVGGFALGAAVAIYFITRPKKRRAEPEIQESEKVVKFPRGRVR